MKKPEYSKYYWQNDIVRLRPIAEKDLEDAYHNLFDSESRFFLDSLIELPFDEILAEHRWKDYWGIGFDKNNRIRLTIETLDDINVGSINLNSIDERNGTFSIGMQINIGCRNKGYGTAAMKILLDYAFNERRLNKYQGFVIEGNIASETMLKKLGCIKEGVIRGTTFHKGKHWNEIHYGLFSEEFYKINKKDN
jgi:RimJ/RimL family protein N-acetyltransferase